MTLVEACEGKNRVQNTSLIGLVGFFNKCFLQMLNGFFFPSGAIVFATYASS